MSILIVLIVVSLMLAGGFLIAFLYAMRKGQFDDTYTPSVRILMDSSSHNQSMEKK